MSHACKRLRRLAVPLSTATVLLAVAAGGADAAGESARASASYKRCGTVIITPHSGAGFADVRALNITCGNARSTLRRWANNRYRPTTGPYTWRCTPARPAQRSTCRRGTQRITFLSGT
jgi:hypothetical protein